MNDLGEELPVTEDYLIGPEIIADSMLDAWNGKPSRQNPPKTMIKTEKVDGKKKIVKSGVDNL